MLSSIVQAAFIIAIATAVLILSKHLSIIRIVSPVFTCYFIGILFGNQGFIPFDRNLSLTFGSFSVALAIPLMLFSVDFKGWLRLAKTTVLSFFLCIVAGFLGAALPAYFFRDTLADSPKMAGMLVGVYVGGTANMNAIGAALGVKPEVFMKLNAADMIASTLYLVFLLTIAQRVLGLFLPSFVPRQASKEQQTEEKTGGFELIKSVIAGTLLALAVVAAGTAISRLFSEMARDTVSLLVITTLAILLSFHPSVRRIKKTYETGTYFLLIFCLAVGTTADFGELIASSLMIFAFTMIVMTVSILIHYLLAAFFRIDRDTVIITSTAAIWSPAIIPPVVVAIKNNELLVSGIASGLVGFAVANYVGLAVAWLFS